MAHQFIADLKPGQRLDDVVFLIRSKDLRTTTEGRLYIHAVLVDRTGQIVARMWQATEGMYRAMPEGGFMRFKGRVENYKGNLQFIIDGILIADPGTYSVADFLPTTERDREKMWKRLVEILRGIKNGDVLALVEAFLADKALMERFQAAPAAATMHHAYIGGLLEHTLNVLEVALRVIPLYPKLNLDLVLAGVFLHDIGKSKELTFETNIAYSDSGQLLGHIVQATMMIEQKADALAASGKPIPDRLRWELQHIVVSHHGSYQFGSPKLPAIPEAVAVHYLDNLDAKVNMFLSEIENHPDPASRWTNYNRALETRIFKPDPTGTRTS